MKKDNDLINAECHICGNVSSYDKESLKGSTWKINGVEVILCIPCEDDLLVKIAKGRGLNIKVSGNGEIYNVLSKKKTQQIEQELSKTMMMDDLEDVMLMINNP